VMVVATAAVTQAEAKAAEGRVGATAAVAAVTEAEAKAAGVGGCSRRQVNRSHVRRVREEMDVWQEPAMSRAMLVPRSPRRNAAPMPWSTRQAIPSSLAPLMALVQVASERRAYKAVASELVARAVGCLNVATVRGGSRRRSVARRATGYHDGLAAAHCSERSA